MPNDPDSSAHDDRPQLIVGVGASAGGLEAFQRLLEQLPADAPLSVVFVLHLLPTHKSMLSELLAKSTGMRVSQAENGDRLAAGHVYIIPPDAYIEVHDGQLHLAPRRLESSSFLPIDRFFISLANDAGERSVGVVLSGMGSDGAIGLRQIKEAGGVTFCQPPEQAERDDMPRAAMATGDADFVLPPAEIARALVDLTRHPYLAPAAQVEEALHLRPNEEQFQRIFALMRTASGVDFSHYKRPTIERRLLRRMALHKIANAAEYLHMLEERPQEALQLYRDVLIHVTFFFREPESFAALTEKALPVLCDERRSGEALRIWIPGCSSGEEPYSVAMLLLEHLADKADEIPVQIFATDVSETAIEAARAGLYAEPAVRPIAPERLRRFFSQVDGKYRVSKKVREMCIFARHDLTRDPPFSRLDMVICRNVLIYLDQALQKRLFSAFHYALKPNGFLMLGAAESVGLQRDLFSVVDKKHRLYSKRPVYLEPLDLMFAEGRHGDRTVAPPAVKPVREHPLRKGVQQEVNQLLLAKYSPPGVLVNDRFEIIQFRGQTGFFLEPAPGEVNLNVLKMVRAGLLHDLQQALVEARESQTAARKEGLRVDFNGHGRDIDLEVTPIAMPDEPMHYLILFENAAHRASAAPPPPPVEAPPTGSSLAEVERDLDHTRRELETTRRYLQSAIQDLEITNEELQSANEEVLSSNEELQSTNEELDTAKEELQSTNEELNTLNAELHSRNDELSRLNSDLINLLSSVQLAVIMVDRELCIRRFTPAAEKLFNLIAGDVGRPMQHIKPNIVCPNLEQSIHAVIDNITPLEQEVHDLSDRWYSLRVRPYCSLDNRIEGAVIALVDIDAVKRREMQTEESRRRTMAIVQAVREALLVLDSNLRVLMVNEAFCRMFGMEMAAAIGQSVFDLSEGAWQEPRVRALLAATLSDGESQSEVPWEHDFPGVGRQKLVLGARRVAGLEDQPPLALLAIRRER